MFQCSPTFAMLYRSLGWIQLKKMLEYGVQHMTAKHHAIMRDYEERKNVTQIAFAGAGSCS